MKYEELLDLESKYIIRMTRDIETIKYQYDLEDIKKSLDKVIMDASLKKVPDYNGTIFQLYPEKLQDLEMLYDTDYLNGTISFCFNHFLLDRTPEELIEDFNMFLEQNETDFIYLRYCSILGGESFKEFVFKRHNDKSFSPAEFKNCEALDLFKKGEHLEGIDCLNEAFRLNPKYTMPLINKSIILRSMGLYNASLETLLKAVEIAPRNKLGWYELSVTYLVLNDEKALEALAKAHVIDPDYGPVNNLLGKIEKFNL